jgi:hypothetical protein
MPLPDPITAARQRQSAREAYEAPCLIPPRWSEAVSVSYEIDWLKEAHSLYGQLQSMGRKFEHAAAAHEEAEARTVTLKSALDHESERADVAEAEVTLLNDLVAGWIRQNLAIVALEVEARNRAEAAETRVKELEVECSVARTRLAFRQMNMNAISKARAATADMLTDGAVEPVARAICKTWGYEWDGDPDTDEQVAPEEDRYDMRPPKQLFREAARAAINALKDAE